MTDMNRRHVLRQGVLGGLAVAASGGFRSSMASLLASKH